MPSFRPIRPQVRQNDVRRRDPLDDPRGGSECPNCGAEVPARALACPDCGSDEVTGWSESAGFELPGEAGDQTDFKRPRWVLWLAGAVLLSYALLQIGGRM